jgi:hypothetical protein
MPAGPSASARACSVLRVVLLDHGHHLDVVDQLIHADRLASAQPLDQRGQPPPDLLGLGDLRLDALQVPLDELEQRRRRLHQQGPGDLLERQPEPAQQRDPVQPPDVVRRVQPVPGPAAVRRHQQPDLLVVVQRADGQPGPLRQLADLHQRRHGQVSVGPPAA